MAIAAPRLRRGSCGSERVDGLGSDGEVLRRRHHRGRHSGVLSPYVDAPHSCGLPVWEPAELAEAVSAVDAAGFQAHIHAIGDAGVRAALDAFARAHDDNGPRDRRSVIAHTQLIDPADLRRFAELGVIANFEPLWHCAEPGLTDLVLPRIGDRAVLHYATGSIVGSGAHMSFGSDWPVSSMRPLDGLSVAVTRQTPDGEPSDGWLPEERVTAEVAFKAYTSGVAYQAFEERPLGSRRCRDARRSRWPRAGSFHVRASCVAADPGHRYLARRAEDVRLTASRCPRRATSRACGRQRGSC